MRLDSERACDVLESGDAGGPLRGVDGETNEMEQDSMDKVERDTPDEGVSEEVVAHDSESGTWWVFVLRYERQQKVDERFEELVEEGWSSDCPVPRWPYLSDRVCKGHFKHPGDND